MQVSPKEYYEIYIDLRSIPGGPSMIIHPITGYPKAMNN